MTFPRSRGRRLRRTEALRLAVRETRLHIESLVQPLFVREGTGVENPVGSMPGQFQRSPDRAAIAAADLREQGIRSVLLFGIPETKDATGASSVDPEGVVPQAIRAIKQAVPDMTVIADVCLCEFTDHGHCGVLREDAPEGAPVIDNDATLAVLGAQALTFADAGCDILAPSAMADGQVLAIRDTLDDHGHTELAILSYSAKYASAFYGPFRDAAENAPGEGDRRAYQMDPGNAKEALREVEMDIGEGTDMVMVKPAMPYLDIISRIRDSVDIPVAAYQVSGEYSMIMAAGEKNWVDSDAALLESLRSIRRAGADLIITYGAARAAELLNEQGGT